MKTVLVLFLVGCGTLAVPLTTPLQQQQQQLQQTQGTEQKEQDVGQLVGIGAVQGVQLLDSQQTPGTRHIGGQQPVTRVPLRPSVGATWKWGPQGSQSRQQGFGQQGIGQQGQPQLRFGQQGPWQSQISTSGIGQRGVGPQGLLRGQQQYRIGQQTQQSSWNLLGQHQTGGWANRQPLGPASVQQQTSQAQEQQQQLNQIQAQLQEAQQAIEQGIVSPQKEVQIQRQSQQAEQLQQELDQVFEQLQQYGQGGQQVPSGVLAQVQSAQAHLQQGIDQLQQQVAQSQQQTQKYGGIGQQQSLGPIGQHQAGALAKNPWLTRKYQGQLVHQTQFGSAGVKQPVNQAQQQQQQLNQIQAQLQEAQQAIEQGIVSPQKEVQIQRQSQQAEQLQHELDQVFEQLQQYGEGGQQVPSGVLAQVRSSVSQLQQGINQLQQQVAQSQQPWQQQTQKYGGIGQQQSPFGQLGPMGQTGILAKNPWLARKYQGQLVRQAQFGSSGVQQKINQAKQQQQQLDQVLAQLQQAQQAVQQGIVSPQQETQIQRQSQQAEQLQQQLDQVFEQLQQYGQGGQQVPSGVLAQIQTIQTQLQQEINQLQQQVQQSQQQGQQRGGIRQPIGQRWGQIGQRVGQIGQRVGQVGPIGRAQQNLLGRLRQQQRVSQRGLQSQSQGQTIRQRQEQAGQLPNQWDEDQTEQGTFQDIVQTYTVRQKNPNLQQQQQAAQMEAQNVRVSPDMEQIQIADPQILQKQNDVLRLVKNINQLPTDNEIVQIANTFSIQAEAGKFTDPQAVSNLLKQLERGLLPRGEIFSVFNPDHLKQVVTLFKVLYTAEDWETFFNTAAWARVNVNEGVFLHALSVALVQRGDTDLILLPPTYEIIPQYFINGQVIQKAQNIKQLVSDSAPQQKNFVINANYSGSNLNLDPEQQLSYFLEDVDLNDFYYYYYLNYPFWINSEHLKQGGDRRGEQAYYFLQQMLARYYMERLSNGMGSIPDINLQKQTIETGYVPSLRYPNGLEFPPRPSNVYLGRDDEVEALQAFARRIQDAIDSNLVIDEDGNIVPLEGEEGFDTLLNIVQSTPDSPNPQYYGALEMVARWVLGNSLEPLDQNKLVPSALEHIETTLRDPAAWQAAKKIVKLVQQYKQQLPSYNEQQLVFPGVQVQSVQVDPLVTYFEQKDVDITNAVYVNDQEPEDSVKIWARQARLNNKPFAVKINVNSEQSQPAVVRIFLGPKYDEYGREININENRLNFFELDKFQVQLQSGSNNIVRSSKQMNAVEDYITGQQLKDQVQQALDQQGVLEVQVSDVLTAFPQRLLLPKGQRGGQLFQIFVIVTPLVQTPEQQQVLEQLQETVLGQISVIQGGILNQHVDSLPLGYPLDREIDEAVIVNVPNAAIQDVVITHEGPEIVEAQSEIQIQGQL